MANTYSYNEKCIIIIRANASCYKVNCDHDSWDKAVKFKRSPTPINGCTYLNPVLHFSMISLGHKNSLILRDFSDY